MCTVAGNVQNMKPVGVCAKYEACKCTLVENVQKNMSVSVQWLEMCKI